MGYVKKKKQMLIYIKSIEISETFDVKYLSSYNDGWCLITAFILTDLSLVWDWAGDLTKKSQSVNLTALYEKHFRYKDVICDFSFIWSTLKKKKNTGHATGVTFIGYVTGTFAVWTWIPSWQLISNFVPDWWPWKIVLFFFLPNTGYEYGQHLHCRLCLCSSFSWQLFFYLFYSNSS